MSHHRYVRLCYEMMVYYDRLGHRNRATFIKNNLYSNGFGSIWENQDTIDTTIFLSVYIRRLISQYYQIWSANCANNHKLMHYIKFKT